MPLTIDPGTIQLARSPVDGDLHPAEDGGVDVAAADHREAQRRVEERGARQHGDGLLAGVDEVGVDLVVVGVGPTPRMPFSACRVTVEAAGRWPGIIVGRPIPRLTYSPGFSSSAARAAISSRVQLMPSAASRGRVVRFSMSFSGAWAGVSSTTRWTKTPGRWTSSGSMLADLDDLLGLDDRQSPGHRGAGVEVAGRGVEDAVAGTVHLGGPDEGDVGDDRLLEHHLDAVEGAYLLGRRGQRHGAVGVVAPGQAALGDHRADAGRGEERPDAGPAGPHPLGQGALRGELDGQLTGEVLPAELLVLADVRRDDPGDPPRLEQQAEARAVDAAVVGDDREVVGALVEEGADQRPRDADEAEATDRQAGAGRDVGDGLVGAADDLVDAVDGAHADPPFRCAMIAGVMVCGCSALARWADSGTTSRRPSCTLVGDRLEVRGRGGRVVGARDRERRGADAGEVVAQVHLGDDLAARGVALGRGRRHDALARGLHVGVLLQELRGVPPRDDGLGHGGAPVRAHGRGAVVPRARRLEPGAGAQHHEAVDAIGVPGGEAHAGHAAQREADDVRLLHAEGVEQGDDVVGEVVDVVGALRDGRAAVAAGVVADDAEVLGQLVGLGVPHGRRGAEGVGQDDDGRVLRPGHDVVDLDGAHFRGPWSKRSEASIRLG